MGKGNSINIKTLEQPHPRGFVLTTLVVIDTACSGNCKSNYHTITATTVSSYNDSSIYYLLPLVGLYVPGGHRVVALDPWRQYPPIRHSSPVTPSLGVDNIMLISLSVTCDRSVIFSVYSCFLH
jgi:hypothetical protein